MRSTTVVVCSNNHAHSKPAIARRYIVEMTHNARI